MDNFTEDQVLELELEMHGGLTKEAAVVLKDKRQKEAELHSRFMKNPSQDTFMPLYNSFKPLIFKAAQRNMYGSPLPEYAHKGLATQSFYDAVKTWDAKKGSLNTHVFNTVSEKGKRLNLKFQNIGYIPEARATKYQAYNTSLHLLREELGREPTALELADDMALPVKEIERMQKEIKQDRVINESISMRGGGAMQSDKAMQVARDIQYSLIPKHVLVLERAVGINGHRPLLKKNGGPDVQAIAKDARISVSDVRSALKTISRKFKENMGKIQKADAVDAFFEDVADDVG